MTKIPRTTAPDTDPCCTRWANSGLAEMMTPALLLLGKLIGRRLEVALAGAGLGLTPAQARIILVLHCHGSATQQAIAWRTDVEPSTLVGTLDVMERENLARREPNPADRRSYLVRLTRRGEAIVPKLLMLWSAVEQELVDLVSSEERAALHGQLQRLIAQLADGEAQGEPRHP